MKFSFDLRWFRGTLPAAQFNIIVVIIFMAVTPKVIGIGG